MGGWLTFSFLKLSEVKYSVLRAMLLEVGGAVLVIGDVAVLNGVATTCMDLPRLANRMHIALYQGLAEPHELRLHLHRHV